MDFQTLASAITFSTYPDLWTM